MSWTDYEEGFGDLNTEFWYGLKTIHFLTDNAYKNVTGGSHNIK